MKLNVCFLSDKKKRGERNLEQLKKDLVSFQMLLLWAKES